MPTSTCLAAYLHVPCCVPPRVLLRNSTCLAAYLHVPCCVPPRVLLRTSTCLSAYLHVSCCVPPRALLRTSTCLLGDSPRRDMLEVSRLRSDNNWPPGCESKSCVAVEANESERSTHRATWEQSTRNQSVAARSTSSSACSTMMSSAAGTEHPL